MLCLSSMDGWPISSEVGNTNSAPEFASPTAKAMGHPTLLSIRDGPLGYRREVTHSVTPARQPNASSSQTVPENKNQTDQDRNHHRPKPTQGTLFSR